MKSRTRIQLVTASRCGSVEDGKVDYPYPRLLIEAVAGVVLAMHLHHPPPRRQYFGEHEGQTGGFVDEDPVGFDEIAFVATLFLTKHEPHFGMVAHHFDTEAMDEKREGVAGGDDAELATLLAPERIVVDTYFAGCRRVAVVRGDLHREPVGQLVETGRGTELDADGMSLAVELLVLGLEPAIDGQLRTAQSEVDIETVLDGAVDFFHHGTEGGDERPVRIGRTMLYRPFSDVVDIQRVVEGEGSFVERSLSGELAFGQVDE